MTNSHAEPYRNLLIRASAGTGKTYRLTHRYLGLIVAGEPVEEILAVTFARNAAAEITARVLNRLAEAALEENHRKELAHALGVGEMSSNHCRTLLRQLVRNLHRLRIGTLDSFFAQLARHYSLELRLPPGWRVLDGIDDETIRQEAVQRLLELDDGKTARRLMHLINAGDASRPVASEILSIVSNMYEAYLETPAEAWNRLQRATPGDETEIESALQAIQAYAPSNKIVINGRNQSVELFTQNNWHEFMSKGLSKAVIEETGKYSRVQLPADVCDALQVLVDTAEAHLLNQLIEKTTGTYQLLDGFHAIYQRLKLAVGGLTFGDVPRSLAGALAGKSIGDGAHRMNGRLAHILIDEFQDTSLGQWNVVQHFALACTGLQKRGTLFCVGDIKQAIYGWRGGVAEVFDAASEAIPSLDSENLLESRRSSPPVIQAVNDVFSHLDGNPALDKTPRAKELWQNWFQPHTTFRQELSGYVRLVAAKGPDTGKVDQPAVLRYAAAEIARLSREHPTRTMAVLVRTNEASASILQLLRTEHGIEASEEGGVSLTSSPAVELILSLLKIADHPAHTAARFHVFHSPLREISGITDPTSDAEAFDLSRRLRAALLHHGYGVTLDKTVKHLAPMCDDQNQNRLQKLVQLAYSYDDRATERTSDFVQLVERQQVADPSADRIRVMTIHKSKGLQFDIVILPELYKILARGTPSLVFEREGPLAPVTGVFRYVSSAHLSILPQRLRPYFAAWREPLARESLCNLYVAMTRAVHALHMIVPPEVGGATYAGLLAHALAPSVTAAPGNVLYENGDPGWDDASDATLAPPSSAEAQPALRLLLRKASSRGRNLPRQSPSDLEGSRRIAASAILARPSQQARFRGTAYHVWLAEIGWLEEGLPSNEHLRAVAERADVPRSQIEELLREFHLDLGKESLQNVLSRDAFLARRQHGGASCEVFREREFVVRVDDGLQRGAMDRLVLWRNGKDILAAEVLDFKTDVVADDAGLAVRTEFYRPQLTAYMSAVRHIYRLPPTAVTGQLIYVVANRAVPIEWDGK